MNESQTLPAEMIISHIDQQGEKQNQQFKDLKERFERSDERAEGFRTDIRGEMERIWKAIERLEKTSDRQGDAIEQNNKLIKELLENKDQIKFRWHSWLLAEMAGISAIIATIMSLIIQLLFRFLVKPL